jgi:hypothetical protein
MQKQLSKIFTAVVTAAFAAMAISAVAVPTANAQGKVTKAYCKAHPKDPRCKGMTK